MQSIHNNKEHNLIIPTRPQEQHKQDTQDTSRRPGQQRRSINNTMPIGRCMQMSVENEIALKSMEMRLSA